MSLIEVAMVVGIIALLATLSIPAFNGFRADTKLSHEAQVIAGLVRLAQQRAVAEQINHTLNINTQTRNVQVVNNLSGAVITSHTIDAAITIQSVTGLTDNQVVFNPTGSASISGVITIRNEQNKLTDIEIKPSGYVDITSL